MHGSLVEMIRTKTAECCCSLVEPAGIIQDDPLQLYDAWTCLDKEIVQLFTTLYVDKECITQEVQTILKRFCMNLQRSGKL